MCVVWVEHVHVCEHGYCGATGGDQSHRRMCMERYVVCQCATQAHCNACECATVSDALCISERCTVHQ